MKRICLGTMITLIYQSRIRTADTIKTICDGIFAAYGLAVEDYNKEMPSHLKSGHDPAPGGLIDAARDLTMDQIDKGFEMYVLPLITSLDKGTQPFVVCVRVWISKSQIFHSIETCSSVARICEIRPSATCRLSSKSISSHWLR